MFASPISIYSVGEKEAAIFKVYSTSSIRKGQQLLYVFTSIYTVNTEHFFYEIHTVPMSNFWSDNQNTIKNPKSP